MYNATHVQVEYCGFVQSNGDALMSDANHLLQNLKRPRLLINAARHGAHQYNRGRDLKRLIHVGGTLPASETVVERLISEEQELEETRKSGDATYSVLRHVEVLIAIIGEATLMRRACG